MRVLVLCLLTILAAKANAVNYCDKKYSCIDKPNIACNNTMQFACKDGQLIDLKPYIKDILKEHNERRNLIAGGKLKGFDPVSRMATMQWDKELAKLAELNVKQCKMEHDCHNTEKFPAAGQSLAMGMYYPSNTPKEIMTILRTLIDSWWIENTKCKMDYIRKLPENMDIFSSIGHFTAMVCDSNTHLGCAASKYSTKKDGATLNTYLLACNYASVSFLGQPIYKSGRALSDCKTGQNKQYPNLCSINEKYAI